ncbi:TRAP transporter small permease [Propionivibrio dicarboxylicus]|uniref:TRAP transporter small permease protein n=1 Tax=Propionivibrio dicarboxylicus TaxID=83767 RepID=A0A1G8D1G4_9RHOO|nr:TRAP transporter small permease subunit [Propionivibrio dicarboxylicus]SDH51648.1 TRAP-type C4-dicarboxylate transport system, small permease component [Propionivibrio dicarboxylicus]
MIELLKKIESFIRGAVFVAFLVMIVAVLVQVVARTFMDQAPLWTEEASRVSLLFIMSLGVGASFLTGDLVNVDLALMLMPPSLRRLFDLFSTLLVSIFSFMLVPGAWEFTVSGSWQTSPILGVQMQYVFVSMLIFSVLLGVFGIVKFIRILKQVPVSQPTIH